MPETPSARLGLVGPSGTDLIANGDDVIRALIAVLDAKTAVISSGTLAARPASTVGTPGVVDRFYYVTGDATPANNDILWRDTGTGWVAINPKDHYTKTEADALLAGRVRSNDATPREVRGSVNADGSAANSSGSGWSTSHTASSGIYTVTFATAFGAVPSVTLGLAHTDARIGTNGFGSASSIEIRTRNSAGALTDLPFSFIATGPA